MLEAAPVILSSLPDPNRSSLNTLTIRCPACELRLTTAFELRRHAITEHLASLDVHNRMDIPCFSCTVFTCAVCGVASSECFAIEEHFRANHFVPGHDPLKQCAILAQKVKLVPCSEGSGRDSSDSDEDDPASMVGICTVPEVHHFNSPGMPTNKKQPSLHFSTPISAGPSIKFCKPGSPVRTHNAPSSSTWTQFTTQPSTSQTSASMAIATSKGINTSSDLVTGAGVSTTSRHNVTVVVPDRASGTKAVRLPFQNWAELILRSEKKFMCMLCRRGVYSGRTEVVFHAVTRHLLTNEIEHDLARYARLSDVLKRQIGQYFADGMRIRSGVHYKDAKRVEAALFRSIELHLRFRPLDDTAKEPRVFKCSGCGTSFHDTPAAYAHVNEELRVSLPEFMRARSCPWSLSTREEWVWCVPDLHIEPLPGKTTVSGTGGVLDPNEEVQLVLGDRIHKLGISRASDQPIAARPTTLKTLAPIPSSLAISTTVTSMATSTHGSAGSSTPSVPSLTVITAASTTNTALSNAVMAHNAVATAADVVKSLVAVAGLLQSKPVACVPTAMGSASTAIPIATPIFKIESTESLDHLVVRPS
ncbi:Zinc finger C2H2-type domain-containing protein [Fasciolopsis buskii]|uniref:Zinc finger C2H2-type domain-containing protein n=1 Tax=Fasciolopsis buskii TaxID=27845 RepID=A0A8E0RV75_9TREM|nr:Zinc finger C2H2-type domain-containing protein [Fasciolopsis buski]